MSISFLFVFNSIALGAGLAMDAFSVSLANGLSEPQMSSKKHWGIACCYAFFQTLMPLIGWICIHTIAVWFKEFQKFIPFIALLLLGYLGGKMLVEGIRSLKNPEKAEQRKTLKIRELFVQGVATSIDALSVGFAIADYGVLKALIASLIIGLVTLAISYAGVFLGRKFGLKLAGKATILGGIILIGIGIEIFFF